MLIKLLSNKLLLQLASAYIAGKDWRDALAVASKINNQYGFSGTLDILGEESTSEEQCLHYVQMYIDLIDQVQANKQAITDKRKQLTISFKPSTFCTVSSPSGISGRAHMDKAFDHITKIVDYGFRKNINMTIEAEDHRWADFQLETYFALLNAGFNNLGTVIQSRLFRAQKDIKRFDHRARVRLVIGIYEESNDIAFIVKKEMKERLLTYSRELFDKGAYVELATHDADYIFRFFSEIIIPMNISPDQFENQFLLGVPRLQLQRGLASGSYFSKWMEKNLPTKNLMHLQSLAQSGSLVRLYLPYGSDEVAGPYCKRRLEHNPNLFIYGLKNCLHLDHYMFK